ncbi:dual-specificity kinase [Malassezia sp. CBS 17886]|nr:dual-specificity kinase [Malassezia sp. CBS 17886]
MDGALHAAAPCTPSAGVPPRAEDALPDADGSPLPTPPRVSRLYTGLGDAGTPTDGGSDTAVHAGPCRTPPKSEHAPAAALCQTPGMAFATRSMRSQALSATAPRSVGRSLQKLRASRPNTHVPARRVRRYEDDWEGREDAARDLAEPPATLRAPGPHYAAAQDTPIDPCIAMPPPDIPRRDNNAPAGKEKTHPPPPLRSPLLAIGNHTPDTAARHPPACALGAAQSDEKNADYFPAMMAEARRQQLARFTPPARPGQRSSMKETIFRGCKFIKVRRAGEGGFSTVWQVRGPTSVAALVPGGSDMDGVRMEEMEEEKQGFFAMKQVSLKRLEQQSRDELVQEAQLLEQLALKPGNERYILRYFGHRLSKDTLKILLELGDMDFSHVLKTQAPLSRAQIVDYWRQMLEAVHFIHEVGNLVHTDLKPANFLVVKDRLKLIDFGIAQKIPLGTIHISRDAIVGTPNYMAPEAIKMAKAHGRRVYKAGKASDVWSLGCILYQMVYGRPPFDRLPPDRKLEAIMDRGHTIAFPPHRVLDDPSSEPVDADLLASMKASLQYDADARACLEDLLHHPLVQPHLAESVQVSRQTLRELVKRLRVHALQGELTEANAVERADILFANLRAGAARRA